MSKDNDEVEYEKEEGFVRLNLRRPVNLYVPTDLRDSYDPSEESEAPSATLQLDYVYGYRGRDARNNLFKLASGEVIYFTAAVAVIYNPETHTQRHFLHHTDDIKCIKVHPDGKTVATGQQRGHDSDYPHVCVWDSDTLEVLQKVQDESFKRAINCLTFSNDGEHLAIVDDSPEPILSLWNWNENAKISEAKAASAVVLGAIYSQEEPSRIVTIGKGHLAFWTISDDGMLDRDIALFGDIDKPKYVTTVTSLPDGTVATGDTNGNILLWKKGERTIERAITNVHDGSIFFIKMNENDELMSCGSDAKILFHDSQLENVTRTLQLDGSARAVVDTEQGLFIGTTLNGIVQAVGEEVTAITDGHMEELWGLGCSKIDSTFITAGQDGRIYLRSGDTNKVVWQKYTEGNYQSADIFGGYSVIGGISGHWFILCNKTGEELYKDTVGDEVIQAVRFSPDGSKIAIGSRDNRVYIYDLNLEEKSCVKSAELEGHSSFVSHLDWSEDQQMLRSNSGDYEVLFWKVDGTQVTDSDEYADVTWATNNCILSFNTIGVWPPGVDGTHVNGCNKANEKDLIATGDDQGLVKLFKYPAHLQNAKFEEYLGHSSHVTTVVFMTSDEYVLTAGGRDRTVMKWKVVDS